jgi:hypothetical protein
MERDDFIRISQNKTLVVTCLDLVKNELRYTIKGRIIAHSNVVDFLHGIGNYLGVERIIGVDSPDCTNIE